MPINFQNVSYIYNKKSPFETDALHNINLNLEDGKFIAIVGRTGSGKSTLIQHINALLNPSEGVVDINGFLNSAKKKTRSKHVNTLRKKVGLVFQFSEYQLFEETVEKDVAFAPRNFGASKEEALKLAHEALTKVGLDESFYARSPFELSGGEKRKVAIAGILAVSPQILVLDEPTSGLDPLAAVDMMQLFKKINEEGTTVILVTHDMNIVAEFAKEVVVLEDGKVVEDTTPELLFQKDISQYSLEKPLLYQTIQDLKQKGFKIPSSVNSVDALAKALKENKR